MLAVQVVQVEFVFGIRRKEIKMAKVEITQNIWAIIKDGFVLNTVVFADEELPVSIQSFAEAMGGNLAIDCRLHQIVPSIGSKFKDGKFIVPDLNTYVSDGPITK